MKVYANYRSVPIAITPNFFPCNKNRDAYSSGGRTNRLFSGQNENEAKLTELNLFGQFQLPDKYPVPTKIAKLKSPDFFPENHNIKSKA